MRARRTTSGAVARSAANPSRETETESEETPFDAEGTNAEEVQRVSRRPPKGEQAPKQAKGERLQLRTPHCICLLGSLF